MPSNIKCASRAGNLQCASVPSIMSGRGTVRKPNAAGRSFREPMPGGRACSLLLSPNIVLVQSRINRPKAVSHTMAFPKHKAENPSAEGQILHLWLRELWEDVLVDGGGVESVAVPRPDAASTAGALVGRCL
eukprot:6204610-Pleurochrysis_carterae.AAC.3